MRWFILLSALSFPVCAGTVFNPFISFPSAGGGGSAIWVDNQGTADFDGLGMSATPTRFRITMEMRFNVLAPSLEFIVGDGNNFGIWENDGSFTIFAGACGDAFVSGNAHGLAVDDEFTFLVEGDESGLTGGNQLEISVDGVVVTSIASGCTFGDFSTLFLLADEAGATNADVDFNEIIAESASGAGALAVDFQYGPSNTVAEWNALPEINGAVAAP